MAEPRPEVVRTSGREADGWHVDTSTGGVASNGTAAGRRPRVLGVLDHDGRAWVFVDGEVVVVAPDDDARRGPARPGVNDDLSSPMPATVVAVHVSVGDAVKSGDTLVLLEAMKMEVPLRAPRAGRVTHVRCEAGSLVQPGVPLVTVAEDET